MSIDLDFLQQEENTLNEIPKTGIVVDASCMGNPGVGQYRLYSIDEKKILFESNYFENVTNNQMELLAVLHAISVYQKIVYTDSQTAISWIRNGRINSSSNNEKINKRLLAGLMHISKFTFGLRMWHTRIWGENPADFGRK